MKTLDSTFKYKNVLCNKRKMFVKDYNLRVEVLRRSTGA